MNHAITPYENFNPSTYRDGIVCPACSIDLVAGNVAKVLIQGPDETGKIIATARTVLLMCTVCAIEGREPPHDLRTL